MIKIVKDFKLNLKVLMKDISITAENILDSLIFYFSQQNQKVVVLIDEYDYPVISNIDSSKKADNLRRVLKGFYSVLKANTNDIHFEFLTEVTKLAYTTIFSGVNDVKDISSTEKFSDLLGYTQSELEKYFDSIIKTVCKKKKLSKKTFLNKVKDWYDGYRFSKKDLTVYNPSSINLFFQENCDFNIYTTKPYRENSFQVGIAGLIAGSKELEVRIEDPSACGRADLVVISDKYVYIIELKLEKKASVGLKQIKDKKYFYKYLHDKNYDKKGIILLSLSFDPKAKEIKDYLIETIR